MKQLSALLATMTCVVASSVIAENYATEVTISPNKAKGDFMITAIISELVDKKGTQSEKIIYRPRIETVAGLPASMYAGPDPKDVKYQAEDNINLEVSWSKPGDNEMAVCSVVIKRGDTITSKFKFQLQVEDK